MTPTEIRQVLNDTEAIRVALRKVRETARVAQDRLAKLPGTASQCKIFENTETNAQYSENELNDMSFTLDVSDLNALLNIDTKVKDINGGTK